jgi:hypothetical protein
MVAARYWAKAFHHFMIYNFSEVYHWCKQGDKVARQDED